MRCDPSVQAKMKAIADMYTGKKIIVGRDKLDLVKGVVQKLAAFEKFLMDYPEWRDKVVCILYMHSGKHIYRGQKKLKKKKLFLGCPYPSDRW